MSSTSRRTSGPASILPVESQRLGDEGEDVRVLQDGLGRGLPGAVSAAGVHADHQGLPLLRAATHTMLQGGTELQRVQGNHAVVVIRRQQQNRRVRWARIRRLWKVVERRIPGEEEKGWKEGQRKDV